VSAPASRETYVEGQRSWLADQLLEPTKLVFAVVIAESLREYRVVLTSPIANGHYMATLALIGIYATTVWSWLGWHRAHVRYPYRVGSGAESNRSEVFRFYADLAIVIAYAYTLFQVEPLIQNPEADISWLLLGYPIIIALYCVENAFRRVEYGGSARRTIPLVAAFVLFAAITAGYWLARDWIAPVAKDANDLLWLNGSVLTLCIVVMWGYRHFNELFKRRIDKASG
jgi:hypothetical protein